MENLIIVKWEKIGLAISLIIILIACVVEFCGVGWIKDHPTIMSSVTGLACGFIATIIVLYLERNYEKTKLQKYYLKYSGTYIRTDIGQDNTVESNLVDMRKENLDCAINISYVGGHEFSLIINYWKTKKAQARGFVEFNPKDKKSGKGNYRYVIGEGYIGQFGVLELNWDEIKEEMIVIYRHQYPREIPFNPDANRGWEVWKKMNHTKQQTGKMIK